MWMAGAVASRCFSPTFPTVLAVHTISALVRRAVPRAELKAALGAMVGLVVGRREHHQVGRLDARRISENGGPLPPAPGAHAPGRERLCSTEPESSSYPMSPPESCVPLGAMTMAA